MPSRKDPSLMINTTKSAIRAICATDPTLSAAQIDAALAALDGVPTNTEPYDQILTPVAAAKLLGRDRHTLAAWTKRGLLVAVRTGRAGSRITGYTASSVRAFLAGKANANTNGKEVA